MTIADWMIFAALLLALLPVGLAKGLRVRQFDNANPRDPDFYQTPLQKRARGAHENGLETFPFFAAAIVLAEFRGGPQHVIDMLAIAFLVTRAAYVATYLGNWPTMRSLLWSGAFALNAAIFCIPWWYNR